MDHARCASVEDPDVFFPKHGQNSSRAKRYCAKCPVLTLCREYSIESEQMYGVWGGLSERERQKLIWKQRRDRRGSSDSVVGGSGQHNVPVNRSRGTRTTARDDSTVVYSLRAEAQRGTNGSGGSSIVLWNAAFANRSATFGFVSYERVEPDRQPGDASRDVSGVDEW